MVASLLNVGFSCWPFHPLLQLLILTLEFELMLVGIYDSFLLTVFLLSFLHLFSLLSELLNIPDDTYFPRLRITLVFISHWVPLSIQSC